MKPRLAALFPAVIVALLLPCLLAGNASARGAQLCLKNETPCTSDYAVGTNFELKLASGTILTKLLVGGFGWDECTGFSMSGTTSTTGSATTPVEVPLTALQINGCAGCTVTVIKPGRLVIESIPGTMNAKVRWKEFEFKELCGFPEPCVARSEVSQGIFLKGGSEPILRFENATLSSTCAPMEWSSSNTITTPKPLYISGSTSETFSGAGVLCKSEAKPCSLRYGSGTAITARLKTGTNSILNAGFPVVECGESSMSGEVQDPGSSTEPIVGVWTSWTFGGCNCKVTVPSAGNFSIDWTSGSSGALTLSGFETKAECGGKECIFGSGVSEGITLSGGSPAAIKAVAAPIPKKSGIAECKSTSEWSAEYEVTTPKPLFVAEK
jgi:hypothetical protein